MATQPNPNKRLSDVTREASSNRTNKFADSLMPAAPKPKAEPVPEEAAPVVDQRPDDPTPLAVTEVAQPIVQPVVATATPKPDRARKSAFTIEDVINGSAKEGDAFNKMVRVTDDHHELLRRMAFEHRKPMNVIVHNLLAMLDQVYQKEQRGGQGNV